MTLQRIDRPAGRYGGRKGQTFYKRNHFLAEMRIIRCYCRRTGGSGFRGKGLARADDLEIDQGPLFAEIRERLIHDFAREAHASAALRAAAGPEAKVAK